MSNDAIPSLKQVQSKLEAALGPQATPIGAATTHNVGASNVTETDALNDNQLQDMLTWAHEYSLSQGLDEDTIEHLEQFVKASRREQLVMLYVKLLVIEASIG